MNDAKNADKQILLLHGNILNVFKNFRHNRYITCSYKHPSVWINENIEFRKEFFYGGGLFKMVELKITFLILRNICLSSMIWSQITKIPAMFLYLLFSFQFLIIILADTTGCV